MLKATSSATQKSAVDNQGHGYLMLSSYWASEEHRISLRGIHDEPEAFCNEDVMRDAGTQAAPGG